jgi:ParB-like chromosome segregation protein Spo0J
MPAVPLDKLLLDTNNPRIRAGADEPDCIDRLLRKPKQLLALAKDIAANGLSTAPILVELIKGNKFVVWDGNRRITALKLLNDPSLARNKALQAQFAGVAAKAAVDIPTSVDVLASSTTTCS